MAKTITWNGQTKSAKAWAAVSVSSIYGRIKRGANVDGTEPEGAAVEDADDQAAVDGEGEEDRVEEVAEAQLDPGEEIRPDPVELLELGGIAGAKLVSRTARGSLLWVPASA